MRQVTDSLIGCSTLLVLLGVVAVIFLRFFMTPCQDAQQVLWDMTIWALVAFIGTVGIFVAATIERFCKGAEDDRH